MYTLATSASAHLVSNSLLIIGFFAGVVWIATLDAPADLGTASRARATAQASEPGRPAAVLAPDSARESGYFGRIAELSIAESSY